MIEATPTNSYDQVPYISHPFSQSHPDRLATIAKLFGMEPAPITNSRVLELGAASGGNLIPLAVTLPESEFIGVELSKRQAEEGQEVVKELGLKNIEIRQANILDVDDSYGKFDYIICHGVYSWVPKEVQDHILKINQEQLHPQGVGYVSFNTYPGWNMRGAIREMMNFHVKALEEPKQRIQQARALLNFLVESLQESKTPYAQFLQSEAKLLQRATDNYLFHEHLEEVNEPLYFYEFAERLAANELQYLGEVEFSVMTPASFNQKTQEILQRVAPDIIKMEQYMDFLRNRTFRQTLVCHKETKLNRALGPENVKDFLIASSAKPQGEIELMSGKTGEFRTPAGVGLSTVHPINKAAMIHLAEIWPRATSFSNLAAMARKKLNAPAVVDAQQLKVETDELARCLLLCYRSGMVELHVHTEEFQTEPSEQPEVHRLARHQAKKTNLVTNLRHQLVALDQVQRHMLPLMDGSKTREQIVQELASLVDSGVLNVQGDSGDSLTGNQAKPMLSASLEKALPIIASNALLRK